MSNFMTHLLNLADNDENIIDGYKLLAFNNNLEKILIEKYADIWNPNRSLRYSNRRKIIINPETLDSAIKEASILSNISPKFVHSQLPKEVTIWVDPGEVSFRIFTDIRYLYQADRDNEAWKPRPRILKKLPTTAGCDEVRG